MLVDNEAALRAYLVRQAWELDKIKQLTRRERQVIWLMGSGLSRSQIAKALGLSEHTVNNHFSSIFRKLQVRGYWELAIYAYRHGLARPPV